MCRPCVVRHTVKELQCSFQPASPHRIAPTPDRRGRTVTDMWILNFNSHGAHTDMCGLTVTELSPHRHSADSRVAHGADMCVPTLMRS
ncbi:hypothetical protein J6590_036358 [Homalodisca vitripennis]|nr:hypothetical protein J6590_036358 [Homalodisca vitripennis]